MVTLKTTLHRDGTVTYWSVYRQQWIRQPACFVPDEELVAQGDDRHKIIRHAKLHSRRTRS